MRGFNLKATGANSEWFSFAWTLIVSLTLTTVFAPAARADFSVDKNICIGVPSSYSDPNVCPLAPIVPLNGDVFYVITVSAPFGEPIQSISLTDSFPAGFVVAGSPTCTDQTGASVAISSGSGSSLGTISVMPESAVYCIVRGKFTTAGPKANSVVATNETGVTRQGQANTTVAQVALNVDLSVVKSVTPATIILGSSATPQSVQYKVVVTNAGPDAVDLGAWFTLNDNLRLAPNSVPLVAELDLTAGNFSCSSSLGTDCLDPVGPVPTVGGPRLIGTMGVTDFLSWRFASGSAGHMAPGGTMELKFTVKVSQIPQLKCNKGTSGNGLINTAFFTLFDPATNSAKTEQNFANNSSATTLPVQTSWPADPDCAVGQLKIKKVRVKPSATTVPIVAWGSTVVYRIRIENVSIPNQAITIAPNNFTDWVKEGINTPPFKRTNATVAMAECIASNVSSLCANFNGPAGGGVASGPFNYSYYGQSNMAWRNGRAFTLPHAKFAEFQVAFTYADPDCETVPNTPQRPIVNTARVRYKATPFGTSGPQVWHIQTASETVNMDHQAPCKFIVRKDIPNGAGAALQFGVPTTYAVDFVNNEPERDIGTVADFIRFTSAASATAYPFSSSWTCVPYLSGIVDSTAVTNWTNGSIAAGSTMHTSTPAHGTPAIRLRANPSVPLHFKSGAKLTCNVTITVKRPAFNDPNCYAGKALFENVALMDVTHPFNPNIFWPPSGSYSVSAPSNPSGATTNWAGRSVRAPRCYDATINKSAAIPGLPPNALWTYPGGPSINYSVTMTNTANDSLTGVYSGGTWNGLVVRDKFFPTTIYGPIGLSGGACTPPTWCASMPFPLHIQKQIGARSLAASGSGTWTFSATGPFKVGTAVKNCAKIGPSGTFASSQWYSNYDPSLPLGQSPQSDCVEVPVVDTRSLIIQKMVTDQTGAGNTSAGMFGVNASCAPYPLAAPNGSIGTGSPWTIQHAPVGATCTVSETSEPAVPASAMKACASGVAVWERAPPHSITIQALSPPLQNIVKLNNVLKCATTSPVVGTLRFRKGVANQTGVPLTTSPSFTISAGCSPPSTPPGVVLQHNTDDAVTAPAGTTCSPTETIPPVPASQQAACLAIGQPAQWTPVFNPSGPLTLSAGTTTIVSVMNILSCGPPAGP